MPMIDRTSEAEASVIGSILIQPECLPEILEYCSPDDFLTKAYRDAITVADNQRGDSKAFDAIIIRNVLEREYGYDGDTISKILSECMDVTPTTANCVEYAQIVRQKSMGRKLKSICFDMDGDARERDWQEVASKYIGKLQDLTVNCNHIGLIKGRNWATKFINEEMKIASDPDGAYCSTGFSKLDAMFGGGMFRGGLYVIGARPGVGKTTSALNIAENIVRKGKNLLFVSLEMTDRQIMCKRLSMEYQLPYMALMSGKLDDEQLKTAQIGAKTLSERPFYMNSSTGLTVNEISLLSRKIEKLDLIIIDYLGLIQPAKGSGGSRYEDYTKISGDLKQMALRLNIPILCLSQLNRQNTQRADKEPTLSDLRDTGAVEQDADAVVLLHRDSCYDKVEDGQTKPDTETLKMIVAKNRHGETGVVNMNWQGSTGIISCFDYRGDDYKNYKPQEGEVLPF